MKHFLFLWAFVTAAAFPAFCAQDASTTMEVESADDFQAIADQFASLSGNLSQLPTPPRLDQKIELPFPEPERDSQQEDAS